jgi:superfamily II DNA or RNA helicase
MTILCEDLNESWCKLNFDGITDPYKQAEMKVMFADQLSAFTEGYKFNPQFRAGIWDGKKKFYKIIGNTMVFPKGMVKYLERKVQKTQPDVNFIYSTNTAYKQVTKDTFDAFLTSLNLPFEPYDYQYNAAFEAINSGRLTIGAATSAGKSFIIYIIFRWMLNHDVKTMLIVPNVMLVNQMYQDFVDYGFDVIADFIVRIGGDHCKTIEEKRELFADNLEGGKNIISTWQSLYNSPDLFSTIGCIIVDEVHGAKSEVFSDIIMPSAISSKYRFGLTGTMPPGYADKLSILGTIGPHKRFVNAQGLIDRGLATPVEIKMLFLNYSDEDKDQMKKIPKYQDELKYIEIHPKRNEILAKYTNKISQSGNTLVMFSKIDHGKLLLKTFLMYKFGIKEVEFLDKITPKTLSELPADTKRVFVNTELSTKQINNIIKAEFDPSIFEALEKYNIFLIYGGVEDDEREQIRKILETKSDAVVYASFGTMSTGVSIKRIHHIILASTTKSPIRLQQTVGRGMRLHESKEWVKIWDVVDDFSKRNKKGEVVSTSRNYCLAHADERLALYQDNGYPIAEVEINL